jgi:hypothetical protein
VSILEAIVKRKRQKQKAAAALMFMLTRSHAPSLKKIVQTVETRHFCGTSWDATYYKLLTAQSGTAKQYGASSGTKIGIRVFKRSSGGVSTEITSGTPVAVATYTADGMHSATWNCPDVSLSPTDAIEVRVYIYTTKWLSAFAYFKTEQLNGQSLDASTWTVYYYLTLVSGTLTFYWDGDSTHDSRIENFTWTG